MAAINIRNVAAACGVSVGSIYYYFNSKAALTSATVERIWCDIFHFSETNLHFDGFLYCVQWLFCCIREGNEKYPNFFTSHSMYFLEEDKANGQQLMAQSWEQIQSQLYTAFTQDKEIHSEVFDNILSPQKFIDIVFSLVLSTLVRQNDEHAILQMIRKIIY